MNTYRNLFFVTVGLLVIAVAALITIIAGKEDPKAAVQSTVQPGYGFDYISSKLQFDAEQKEAFSKLVSDYRTATEPLYQQLNGIQHEIADELGAPEPDSAKLDDCNVRMAGVYALIKKETIRHMLRVRNICSPEQSAQLGKMYRSVVDETSRWHKRGGHGQGRNRYRFGQER